MYKFAVCPTQSRRWTFYAECLIRVATNSPYTTTQHPSLSKISDGGSRQVGTALRQVYTRANRCPPSALRAPTRLNSARIPASSPLLACNPRLSFRRTLIAPPPKHTGLLQISQVLFSPPCLADDVDTLPVGRQSVVLIKTTTVTPPGKGLGLLVWTVRPSAISREHR